MLLLGAVARLSAAFGQGTGPIFLDDVMCNGLESRLFDCAHRGIEVDNCVHSQDAGVECVAGTDAWNRDMARSGKGRKAVITYKNVP